MRRWKFADQYQAELDALGPGQMLFLRHGGVSPFTFDAMDRDGRYHSIWILDYERVNALLVDGPRPMTVRRWQRDGTGADLAEIAWSGGAPQ